MRSRCPERIKVKTTIEVGKHSPILSDSLRADDDPESLISLAGLSGWVAQFIEEVMLQLIIYQTAAEHALFQLIENKESFSLTDYIDLVCTESNKPALSSLQRGHLST